MKKKYYLLVIVLVLLLAGAGAWWQYNKPARNLTSENAAEILTATDLYSQFSENEVAANKKYLDKVIQVRGILTGINRSADGSLNLTLETGSETGGVSCEVPAANINSSIKLETGRNIAVKGQCTGFLMDVVLVKCVIMP